MDKECNLCHQLVPLTDFYRAAKTRDGYGYTCKPCSVKRTRQWNLDHPVEHAAAQKRHQQTSVYKVTRKARRDGPEREVILAQKRASYERHQAEILEKNQGKRGNPRTTEAARARYAKWKDANPRGELIQSLARIYKTTIEHYDKMVVAQSGRCAICSTVLTEPHVDHDHVTGRVRGLLCPPCNRGLGMFKDDPGLLHVAAAYLS